MNRPPTKQTQEKSFQFKTIQLQVVTSVQQQVPPYRRKFDPKQAHRSKDWCSKCGDSRHVEGFKCPAKKYQCKSCHKKGHFTNLCLKKQVPFKPKAPKGHQLQAEEVCTHEDSLCGQSEELTLTNES